MRNKDLGNCCFFAFWYCNVFHFQREKTKYTNCTSGPWPSVLYNPLTLRLHVVLWTSELAEVCQSVSHNSSEVRDKKAEWGMKPPGSDFWFGAYKHLPSLILCHLDSVRIWLWEKSQPWFRSIIKTIGIKETRSDESHYSGLLTVNTLNQSFFLWRTLSHSV